MQPLTDTSVAGARDRNGAAAGPSARLRGLVAGGSIAAVVALFFAYERLSATAPVTADSANAVLQGLSMATGNPLLRGWTLSGASFYVTDLPLYALLAALRGLSPAVAHDAGAALYTLMVVAACLLARGRATGGLQAAGRMAVTLVLLVAPAPGPAAQLLLLGPFHVGTTLLVLLGLLALDAWAEHPAGAVVCGLVLALAVLSDALALYVGIVPVIVVSAIRLAGSRRPAPADPRVLVAAVLAVPAAIALGWGLHRLGGFATVPLQASFADIYDLPKNAALTVQGALLLFGADFFGQPIARVSTLPVLLHLLGFAFVLISCRRACKAWRRSEEHDLVTQVALVAIAVDGAAYLFSNQAIDLMTSRYLIPAMALGAVVAGRCGADWLWGGRRALVAGLVALGYVGFLAVSLRTPPAITPAAQAASYLEREHLTYGLAAYWQASAVTVETGGRVRVRALNLGGQVPSPYLWEAEPSWYDPSLPGNDARFVLRDTWDPRSVDPLAVEAAFGPPVQVVWFGHFELLIWDRNLLNDVYRPPPSP